MAAPTLTPAEIAQLEAEKAKQESSAATFLAAIPAKDARAAELAVQDGSFKKFFDYYNDDIISQYDAERKEYDGLFIVDPIVEDDILKPANLEFHRTTPALPDTDLIRIPEFDGGGTSTDTVNEQQHITDQAPVEDLLKNGVSGTTPTVTATSLTATALTALSTQLDMLDAVGPMSFTIGDQFVVHNGGTDVAVLEVTGVTDNVGGDPPYDITLDITFIVPPSGTIAIGSDVIDSFTGFTNTERTNKVATDSNLQPLMDSLIVSLEAVLTLRQARLAAEIVAIDLNQDPDGVAQLTTAKTNAQTSDAFIVNYKISTDISDTGLASLASERGTRGGQITARIAEIVANYTGQTENYYDRRYDTGNDRGSTSRGTLRLQKNAESGSTTAQAYADNAQAQVDAIDALLNP